MFQMYGVVPPMVTPFRENGEVDYEGLAALVQFLSGQVDGLFINGSYGGGVLMTSAKGWQKPRSKPSRARSR